MLLICGINTNVEHLGSLHIADGGDLLNVCCVLQRNPDGHSIAHVGPAVPHHRNTSIGCNTTEAFTMHAVVTLNNVRNDTVEFIDLS